jgi:hypothetical protein
LLHVRLDGEDVLWESYFARKLAERLGVSAERLSQNPCFNEVAMLYFDQGGERRRIYSRLKAIMDEESIPLPDSLRKLARISEFSLFVSLTFDSLLRDAINEERFQGERRTETLSYSPNREIEDLPDRLPDLRTPYVYRIFGELSSTSDYAVTDEDILEFTHALQTDKHPKNLFDELRQYHLLFLGCGFQNWLERFVVRTISNNRLLTRETYGFVADDYARQDVNLTVFLKHYKTEVFLSGCATVFVDELYHRWLERCPEQGDDAGTGGRPPALAKMETDAVFLSFSGKDRVAVRNMREALEKAGIDVWFDDGDLRSGTAWDQEIRTNIRRCSFFLPFVSRHAQHRLEGYFRKEWTWAIERSDGMDTSLRFIRPIMVDDIPDNADHIPERFWVIQVSRFPEGRPSRGFVDDLVQALRQRRLREAGYK